MADFRKNPPKYAEDNVSSDEENDDVLSEGESEDKKVEEESFPGEDDDSASAESPTDFLEDLSEDASVLAPCKQSSTPAQSLSKKSSKKKEINKEKTLESKGSDSVGKKQKKGMPKLLWSQDLQNDLVDIICNNEHYKRKLIFTNSKNSSNAEVYESVIKELKKRCAERNEVFKHNVKQTRNKFKKLMSNCKNALLTQKTASGNKEIPRSKAFWAVV